MHVDDRIVNPELPADSTHGVCKDTCASGMRFNLSEAAGGLGDLGIFIPLLVGMVNRCGLQLGPALFLAGAMNVITGLLFQIPMPVQPMKAIAVVAISEGFQRGPDPGGRNHLRRSAPRAGHYRFDGLVESDNSQQRSPRPAVGTRTETRLRRHWNGDQDPCVGRLGQYRRRPAVCGDCFLAAPVEAAAGRPGHLCHWPDLLVWSTRRSYRELHFGISWHLPDLGNLGDWQRGLLQAALPQIPLTLLNSVIAVCALSKDLFPRSPAQPKRVAISVALMNLVCCPLGGMPMCHGAGGLAGQYRFGARTGGSIVMLGGAKMLLALVFGGSLLFCMQNYPHSVLGLLLACSGLELAIVCRDQRTLRALMVVAVTTVASLAIGLAVGFAAGWLLAIVLLWVDRFSRPRGEET